MRRILARSWSSFCTLYSTPAIFCSPNFHFFSLLCFTSACHFLARSGLVSLLIPSRDESGRLFSPWSISQGFFATAGVVGESGRVASGGEGGGDVGRRSDWRRGVKSVLSTSMKGICVSALKRNACCFCALATNSGWTVPRATTGESAKQRFHGGACVASALGITCIVSVAFACSCMCVTFQPRQ